MLTPHAVDRFVICAVFHWLRGLEPLATTPWQQQQQCKECQGISETLSTGRETSWGAENRSDSRMFTLLTKRKRICSKGEEEGVKESINIQELLSYLQGLLLCLWLCV